MNSKRTNTDTAITNDSITLFVYGTLMRGRAAHHLLNEHHARCLGQAWLRGFALYDLGRYPGIVPERDARVAGELYEVPRTALEALDRFEGQGSLFVRTTITALTGQAATLRAQAYVYIHPVQGAQPVPEDRQPWQSGWQEGNDLVWYACYGANLSRQRFLDRYISVCRDKTPPSADKPCLLHLPMYFAGKSSGWQGCVAFLGNSEEPGRVTFGRVWQVRRSQLATIQIEEGSGPRWYGNRICLGDMDGLKVYTLTRQSRHDHEEIGLPPQNYLDVIRTGLAETWPLMDREAYLQDVLAYTKQLMDGRMA